MTQKQELLKKEKKIPSVGQSSAAPRSWPDFRLFLKGLEEEPHISPCLGRLMPSSSLPGPHLNLSGGMVMM